ncbi:MAG: patatin-like phospholipase family protein [Pseudomonadota bacterium]
MTLALHLPGGGARGAYQVGALKAVTEICNESCSPFQVFTGTSAGAINALVLASHADRFPHGVERLDKFWSAMRCKHIYRVDWPTVLASAVRWIGAAFLGRLGVPAPASLLNTQPLKRLLEAETQLDRIEQLISQQLLRGVAVSASGYSTGRSVSFFQAPPEQKPWGQGRRVSVRDLITTDHLLASTALPLLFPPVRLNNEFFGDGSLRQTAPLSPAIHLGARKILVITARDGQQDREPTVPAGMPSAGDIAGHLLDLVFMDHLDSDLERLHRVNHTLSLVPETQSRQSTLRPVETLVLRPSADLRALVATHIGAMPASVKTLLAGIGAWGRDNRLASYLLFDQAYTRALIDLGYRDTLKSREQVVTFISDRPAGPDAPHRAVSRPRSAASDTDQ